MSGLRMELFMAAAQSTSAVAALMPFPACFFDPVQKTKRFDALLQHINEIPALKTLDELTPSVDKLPPITWRLLYWVLTNPLTIQPVEFNSETLTNWEQQTGLKLDGFLYYHSIRTFLFQVVNPNPKKEFLEGKAKYGTMFAFHGSKLENFHSIVHRGLISGLNVRSVHGIGSYLCTKLDVSMHYTDKGWKKSCEHGDFGPYLRCVAICEVVKHPDLHRAKYSIVQKDAEESILVADKDEFIQLSHLILFVRNRPTIS